MAQESTRQPRRLVDFTDAAREEMVDIYIHTSKHWGENRAQDYYEFLETAMQNAADRPALSPLVEDLNGIRSQVVRWKNARFGHRFFFWETDSGILVIGILHTSRNWKQYFDISE